METIKSVNKKFWICVVGGVFALTLMTGCASENAEIENEMAEEESDSVNIEAITNDNNNDDVDAYDEDQANQAALEEAVNYITINEVSYNRLVQILENDGFTTEEAEYAADNCGADWNEQALTTAQVYLDSGIYSRQSLIEALLDDGYTEDQAEYAADNCGVDYTQQAMRAAEDLVNKTPDISHDDLIAELTNYGFTEDEADSAAESVEK
ncbi:MAG: Ltp family lipoprotein [Eggerthellaceae bacterium]|nr:Ltp family lipoprotein [Eggerthellaceae bacterium]